MNLAEHPIALDIRRRLLDSKDENGNQIDYVPATVVFPGMPNLMGELRPSDKTPGLFSLTSIVELGQGGKKGLMDFCFTADRPITIIYPADAERVQAHRDRQSRIIRPQ
jgi:hypothetical protein